MRRASLPLVVIVTLLAGSFPRAASEPVRARGGMVVAQERLAAQVGADILRDGGNAIDATVATAFALAVTFPFAGNIGGGGFMIVRTAGGETAAYDFRETAPAGSSPTMFMREGRYDARLHHDSHLAVGVPGTVAGLHLAWRAHGTLPWQRLVRPAITLARDGFVVSDGLARSLAGVLDEM
ncbi:MAG: gamma-glutamyltransferase, partial [Vicinamibacterales bacterium]